MRVTDNQSAHGRMPLMPTQTRAGRWRLFLLIAMFGAVAVLGATMWGIRTAFNLSTRKAILANLAAVALSLVNYSEFHGHLPYAVRLDSREQLLESGSPNGFRRPLYSWRVEIVPYLESWHGSWDPTQPWNQPANRQLIELSAFYVYDAPALASQPQPFPETNVLAITGPGTAFGDGLECPRALKDVPPDTILVVETQASGIPWPAPGDLYIRTMPQTINAPDGKGISGLNADGFHLVFADGQVWYMSKRVPFETLKLFFKVADAQKNDREQLLGPFAVDRGP